MTVYVFQIDDNRFWAFGPSPFGKANKRTGQVGVLGKCGDTKRCALQRLAMRLKGNTKYREAFDSIKYLKHRVSVEKAHRIACKRIGT